MRLYPSLLFLSGLAAGILAADLCGLGYWSAIALGAGAAAVYLTLTFFSSSGADNRFLHSLRPVWVVMLLAAVGIVDVALNRTESAPLPEELPVLATVEESGSTEGSYVVALEGGQRAAIYTLVELRPGDIVAISDTLRPAGPNLNLRNPETLYAAKMRRGIHFSKSVDEENIAVVGSNPRYMLKRGAHSARTYLSSRLRESSLSPAAVAFTEALVLGDDSDLTDADRKRFSEAGLAHILAVSGLHVGVLTAMLLAALAPAGVLWGYRRQFLVLILLLWGYALLTGLSPATVRATLMATLYFGCVVMQRRSYPVNSYLWALFIILLVSPFDLFAPGFQLSAVCVGAMLLFLPKLRLPEHTNRRLAWALGLAAASVVAVAASWALTAYYFGSLSRSFLLANLIVAPLLPPYFCLSAAYIFLLALGVDFHLLGNLVSAGCAGLFKLGELCASPMPLRISGTTAMLWLLSLLALALPLYVRRARRLRASVPALICLAAAVSSLWWSVPPGLERGLIFRNDGTELNVVQCLGAREETVTFPATHASHRVLDGVAVLMLDAEIPASAQLPPSDILVVGRSFKGDLPDLASRVGAGTVVFHPSMPRSRRERLAGSLSQRGILTHSLRDDGPLRIATGDR